VAALSTFRATGSAAATLTPDASRNPVAQRARAPLDQLIVVLADAELDPPDVLEASREIEDVRLHALDLGSPHGTEQLEVLADLLRRTGRDVLEDLLAQLVVAARSAATILRSRSARSAFSPWNRGSADPRS
jgi:hypothetical protein